MILYVESSAVAKLLVEEAASGRLAAYLDKAAEQGDALLSSMLLETELRRLAERLRLPQAAVTGLLDRLDLVELDRALFREAGLLPGPHLRSLDALHLAVALRANADVMVTYDRRQAEAAESVGLPVQAP
ncbi:type II toxin-antitoxin system VapC family toxin [Pseudonocardia acaciae]|uniref:type II toxin-antitoxin system VapC family toxin n=1 Tax=Pseudonocardia acaciae TaxID=551276 RepID=UPI000683F4B6|nr:type II toxin-antitoxin system VapC family toxin [Pseudonocardia acaciae]